MTWPDGSQYTGKFLDGNRHGQGTMTWPDGSQYVGEFRGGSEPFEVEVFRRAKPILLNRLASLDARGGNHGKYLGELENYKRRFRAKADAQKAGFAYLTGFFGRVWGPVRSGGRGERRRGPNGVLRPARSGRPDEARLGQEGVHVPGRGEPGLDLGQTRTAQVAL